MRTVKHLFDSEFRLNRKLHTIELVFGVLRRIDKAAFRGVEHSLTVLSLAYNRLRRLPEGTFAKLERLQTLDLSFNMFTDNPENASSPLNQALIRRSDWSLQQLNLAGNRLLVVPQRLIVPLRNLRVLNLAGNSIKNLKLDDFKSNVHLLDLNLQGNRIEYIDPKALAPLVKLRHLNLAANCLSQLSSSLHVPESLESINLSHNSIASLDYVQMSHLARLKTISLSSNYIRTPSASFLAGSRESLVSIDLNDNPLDCSCTLRPFIEWLSANKVTLSANTRCYYPEALRGQSLIDQVCWSRCEDDRRQSINFCA
uniref:LRRCT domain-containing protein n=1 Tax=Plectus sambesii TaxID=2011161 RepID=A0A914UMX5_9BILA